MNPAESNFEALYGGNITTLLNKYLLQCQADSTEEETESKRKKRKDSHFPNLAGFCRFIGISTSELEAFGKNHPSEYSKILTVLEDEALNSGASPALVSAYLKKRLGYDGLSIKEADPQLEIKFEHDIFKDGE